MARPGVPQFVPQHVCLSCDKCCRFESEKTHWRAQIAVDEAYKLRREKPALADKIFSKQAVSPDGHFASKPSTNSKNFPCECVFFNHQDNTCSIYTDRPFECELYPFLLRIKENKIFLSFHWACPHMQNEYGTEKYKAYLEKIIAYFQQPMIVKLINENRHLAADYDEYNDEIEDVLLIKDLNLSKDEQPIRLLNNRRELELKLFEEERELSTYSFNAVFLWQDFFEFSVQAIGERLGVFAQNEIGQFMLLPPLGGEITEDVLTKCFYQMDKVNRGSGVTRIENVHEHQLKYFPTDKYIIEKKGHEYCYLKQDIIDLKGNAYKSQRSEYNKFTKSNEKYSYEPYLPEMFDECTALYDRWAENRRQKHEDEIYRHMLSENRLVHRRALEYINQLGLIGRVVKVNGKIAGYTFGYEVNQTMFCVLLEITDLSIDGLSTFIFREFCGDPLLEKYQLINVMDDFGMPNVEKTKMSYHPAKLIPSYTITKR